MSDAVHEGDTSWNGINDTRASALPYRRKNNLIPIALEDPSKRPIDKASVPLMRERPGLENIQMVIHRPGGRKSNRDEPVLAFRKVLVVPVKDDHDVFLGIKASGLGDGVLCEGRANVVVGFVAQDCAEAEAEEGWEDA
jgi:hypothetical protein